MLIKFFPNGKGGGAGPVGYLTARTVLAYDENRDLIRDASGQPKHVTRNPLPEVRPLYNQTVQPIQLDSRVHSQTAVVQKEHSLPLAELGTGAKISRIAERSERLRFDRS